MKKLSLTCIAACVVVGIGACVTACASVIGIGDPALDTEEAGTLPTEASVPYDAAAAQESAPPTDGAPPVPDAGTLGCGPMLTCDPPTTLCCTYRVRGTSTTPTSYNFACSGKCAPLAAGEDLVTTLSCSKFSDCPGKQCCLTLTNSSGTATCKAKCGSNDYLLCAGPPARDTCPDGFDACKDFSMGFPSSFAYCKPN